MFRYLRHFLDFLKVAEDWNAATLWIAKKLAIGIFLSYREHGFLNGDCPDISERLATLGMR